MKCKNKEEILASANYGGKIVSAVIKDNLLEFNFIQKKVKKKEKIFLKNF